MTILLSFVDGGRELRRAIIMLGSYSLLLLAARIVGTQL